LGPVGGGAITRIWHKRTFSPASNGSVWLSTDTADYYLIPIGTVDEDWTLHTDTVGAGKGGPRNLVWYGQCTSAPDVTIQNWIDNFVVCTDVILMLTGLVEDMVVEIYRSSDDGLIDTQTVAAGEDHVHFDLTAEHFPEQIYVKVYATDGVTLVETTASYAMCGGDSWEWTPNVGTIKIASDQFIIYRGAASATPKTAAIVANLKTPAGANYPNALVYFSASNGALSDATDLTDAGGNAHTSLSSLTDTQGIAVVKAQWFGDAVVPACAVYVLVHVFYDVEVGDPDLGFQLYIEGYPVQFVSGRYGVNSQGKPENFEIEIPEWDAEIVPYSLVSIYRKGVQEFAGVYLQPERSLSDSPRVVLTGVDLTFLLSDTVCDLKIYSPNTPQYMIADLLTSFPCGITAGTLDSSPDSLTITITAENLRAAIQRICDNVYWNFRVNLDRTLDFAERFGGSSSGVSFVEGMDILSLDRVEDYSQVKNWVRMVGDGITSTKQDGTSIMAHGLHQMPVFQSSIASQATLDAACQAFLDLSKDKAEMIPMEAIDGLPPGSFKSEDTVWVTSPTLDMNGEYMIKRIERDMTDPDYVKLELSNRLIGYWELDEAYRRMVKDVSV
jgi:hypothetical protein